MAISAFTMPDLAVHDAAILVFTMRRSWCSRSSDTRTHVPARGARRCMGASRGAAQPRDRSGGRGCRWSGRCGPPSRAARAARFGAAAAGQSIRCRRGTSLRWGCVGLGVAVARGDVVGGDLWPEAPKSAAGAGTSRGCCLEGEAPVCERLAEDAYRFRSHAVNGEEFLLAMLRDSFQRLDSMCAELPGRCFSDLVRKISHRAYIWRSHFPRMRHRGNAVTLPRRPVVGGVTTASAVTARVPRRKRARQGWDGAWWARGPGYSLSTRHQPSMWVPSGWDLPSPQAMSRASWVGKSPQVSGPVLMV